MTEPRNPFILGHRIERPYFCDREKEEQRLTSAILNGRNLVLISPRRMGKTSLIHVSLHDSKEINTEHLVFSFDILQTSSLSEFTYLLGRTIFDTLLNKGLTILRGFMAALQSLKGTFGFDAMTGAPTFNIQLGDIQTPEYTLDEIFGYIEQCNKRVLIVIDEFQQVTKYSEKNTEAILRSHIQKMRNASFVFAGSEQTILQEMFVSAKRPFYNSAELMHLDAIPEEVYVGFAQHMFSARERTIEADPIRQVFRLFDGNTFYLQRTMNGAFADTPRGGICSHETVIRSVKSMLAANEVMYRQMLSTISVSQKSTLYAIARERVVANPLSGTFVKGNALTSASSVQSALIKLQKAELISKTEKGYAITDALLRIFINNLYSTPEI